MAVRTCVRRASGDVGCSNPCRFGAAAAGIVEGHGEHDARVRQRVGIVSHHLDDAKPESRRAGIISVDASQRNQRPANQNHHRTSRGRRRKRRIRGRSAHVRIPRGLHWYRVGDFRRGNARTSPRPGVPALKQDGWDSPVRDHPSRHDCGEPARKRNASHERKLALLAR
jgi:hypothetical protein